jgi:hypothetical protein
MSSQQYTEFGPINPGNWDDLNAFLASSVGQADLDAILASVAHVDWHNITVQSRFTNVGQGYSPARYRLTLNNVVHCEGWLAHGAYTGNETLPILVGSLPVGARPGGKLVFPSYMVTQDGSSVYLARKEVWPDGSIYYAGQLITSPHYVSLSNINFSVGA